MQLYVGTSGYSYKEWKGNFYPDKLPAANMLGYYATRLPTVEINNTFYRVPKKSVIENWAEQVPEDFRFIIKVTQRITHFKRLRNASEELAFFVGQMEVLQDRLGALLFQLPPNFKKDADVLAAFLELLPAGMPAAFEFRHDSWFEDGRALELLGRRNCALCIADAEDGAEVPFVATADWAYLRLRRPDYTDADLSRWIERINGESWRRAFVFFKHEDAGVGPRMATRMIELAAER